MAATRRPDDLPFQARADPSADPARAGDGEVVAVLTTDELDLATAHAAVDRPDCGGISVFAGVVRDHHEGDAVAGLAYEAWEEKAVDALRAVGARVLADHRAVRAVYVAHRLGALGIGEVSVVTAASAPHRHQAIDACTALIDQVKASVPVWKREDLAAGGHRWPENAGPGEEVPRVGRSGPPGVPDVPGG